MVRLCVWHSSREVVMAARLVVPLALVLLCAVSDAQLTPAGGKKPHIGAQPFSAGHRAQDGSTFAHRLND